MDRLEAMRVFVAVAEESSFAGGARRLALSPARVTRLIAGLEKALSARLLHRTTRTVRLTESGATYLAHCKRILLDVADAEAAAAASHGELVGQLSITAPVLFGRLCVTPVLLAFSQRHGRVSLRAEFHDSVVDILDQNIDVAVRIARLEDSSLSAIRLGTVRRVVCAAPSYLRAHGVPERPTDLAAHQLITFRGPGVLAEWSFLHDGRTVTVASRPRLTVNHGDVAIAAAIAGHGITRVPSYQVAEHVRNKRLRLLLADYELPPIPVQLVHREGRAASARVRAFVDFAAPRLRAQLQQRAC